MPQESPHIYSTLGQPTRVEHAVAPLGGQIWGHSLLRLILEAGEELRTAACHSPCVDMDRLRRWDQVADRAKAILE